MVNTSEPIHSFTIKDDDEDPSLIWTIIMHPGTYIGTMSMIFVSCIGVYHLKRVWIRPATPRCQPYSPVSLQHAKVDDDVKVAPVSRCECKAEKPKRSHNNHDLHIEQEAERLESCCKQPSLAKGFPVTRSLAPKMKILGMQ